MCEKYNRAISAPPVDASSARCHVLYMVRMGDINVAPDLKRTRMGGRSVNMCAGVNVVESREHLGQDQHEVDQRQIIWRGDRLQRTYTTSHLWPNCLLFPENFPPIPPGSLRGLTVELRTC